MEFVIYTGRGTGKYRLNTGSVIGIVECRGQLGVKLSEVNKVLYSFHT